MIRPGPRNLITDVDGVLVGHAQDDRIKTVSPPLSATSPSLRPSM